MEDHEAEAIVRCALAVADVSGVIGVGYHRGSEHTDPTIVVYVRNYPDGCYATQIVNIMYEHLGGPEEPFLWALCVAYVTHGDTVYNDNTIRLC